MTTPDAPVRDPITGAEVPNPLRFHAGSKPGASLSVRWDRSAELPQPGYTGQEGASTTWTRAIVRTIRKGTPDAIRVFRLEPAPDGPEERIDFEGFYVRGRFRVVERINNPRLALEAWRSFA